MNSILNSPLNPISDKPTSHRSSQGIIYGDMLKQSGVNIQINYNGKLTIHNKYDTMYVYHGNDWSGSLNLFGGAEGYCKGYKFANLVNFSKFKGKVYSLGIKFPPYHELIQNKIKNVYNRFVLFPGTTHHGVQTYGTRDRLTLNFFGMGQTGKLPPLLRSNK